MNLDQNWYALRHLSSTLSNGIILTSLRYKGPRKSPLFGQISEFDANSSIKLPKEVLGHADQFLLTTNLGDHRNRNCFYGLSIRDNSPQFKYLGQAELSQLWNNVFQSY